MEKDRLSKQLEAKDRTRSNYSPIGISNTVFHLEPTYINLGDMSIVVAPGVDQQWLYYRGWPANTGPNTCYGDFGAY